MAKLKLLSNKTIFGLNIIVALLAMLSYLTPYIPPKSFPLLAGISLAVSPLMMLNILFLIYWIIRIKRRMWLSALVMFIGIYHFNAFLQLPGGDNPLPKDSAQIKVMSHNVRLFEAYEPDPDKEVKQKINALISQQQPDILFFQEYYELEGLQFAAYPYSYVHFKPKHKMGHAIFSKYPLLNKKAFDFKGTSNNTIYADVVVGKDTLRVYNMHLQSYRISSSVADFEQKDTQSFKDRIQGAFVEQQQQAEAILEHISKSNLPVILGGDLNNTAFSYIYRQINKSFKDSFVAKGAGLGTTYKVDYFPLRIDYIFAGKGLEIHSHKSLKSNFSDHRPIVSTIYWGATSVKDSK
ncbi:MAG: endonuclease/exonuclease/phosphatase family protein [Gilvibacter sp.]